MNRLLPLLLAFAAATVLAQEGRGRPHGPGPRGQPGMQRPMAPGMSWEERKRLRDELKGVRREALRERAQPPQPMPPEERERLRRDIRDANRDIGGRR